MEEGKRGRNKKTNYAEKNSIMVDSSGDKEINPGICDAQDFMNAAS